MQIRTHPGKYNKIAKSIENLNLNIKSIVLKDKKLVIYTSEAENVLHRLLHIIERKNEKLIDVNVNKPSLAEIFETIEQK